MSAPCSKVRRMTALPSRASLRMSVSCELDELPAEGYDDRLVQAGAPGRPCAGIWTVM